MKCSRRKVRSWFLLVASTAMVLSLSACKTKPKATNIGVLGSRDLVPPPYAKPVATAPSRSSLRPAASPEMPAATTMQSDSEPILPIAEPFVPAETPVYVPAENLPEPEKILTTPPPAAAKVTPAPAATVTTTAPVVPTENLRKYQVQKGDTMSGIAQCIGVKWQDIAALNPSVNPNRMRVGQTLVLPSHAQDKPIVMPKSSKSSRKTAPSGNAVKASSIPSDGVYTVVAGDSLWIISRRFKVSSDDIRTWNNLKTDKLTIGQKLKLKSTATVKETAPKAAVKPATPKTTAVKAEPKVTETAPPPAAPEEPVEAALVTPTEAVPADTANTRAIDHLISENDTLESIAMLYEVKLEDLLRSNPNIKSNADLIPNTTIKIAYPAKK
ncbi:MAG: LysM peptidoglycan-binding domain-containing protein [Lentisphaerae bacterium]|jgi:LysM repeat protein|nr:LysM peptidoglycan-binding domain-containing protein [Lentisphaerota bacterium]